MICPSWIKSLAQPIAVDNVIDYLSGCMMHQETSGNIYEVGGKDKMTYKQLMRVYAKYLNEPVCHTNSVSHHTPVIMLG